MANCNYDPNIRLRFPPGKGPTPEEIAELADIIQKKLDKYVKDNKEVSKCR